MAESKFDDAGDAPLTFSINGEKMVLPAGSVDPTITLNDFLRRRTRWKGTKLGCGEGGCGACAVTTARYDAESDSVQYASLNSCLAPLASLDGVAITTTEGLVAADGAAHPVQTRIAGFNGTQCGFCTPGMVMTMYSALKESADPTALTMSELEARFDGNICRCTGYRPILDAAKSFAADADIEDLVCGDTPVGTYDGSADPAFPDFLRSHKPRRLAFEGSGLRWVQPLSLDAVFAAMAEAEAAGEEAKLIVANTAVGIYKTVTASVFIELKAVPELNGIDVSDGAITVGAAVTIASFLAAIKPLAEADGADSGMAALHRLGQRVANVHVRNAGSVGGNLSLAKTQRFLSDLATPLLALGASVTLASAAGGSRSLSFADFLADAAFGAGELLVSLSIPRDGGAAYVRAYKTALRARNSHSIVNATLSATRGDDGSIAAATLVFGGIADTAVRAEQTEALLAGAAVDGDTLARALACLGGELEPVGDEQVDYRRSLVLSFFYKFFASLAPEGTLAASLAEAADPDSLVESRGVSRGRQLFVPPDDKAPIGKPVSKLAGLRQATGDAKFTDDMPCLESTVHGVYVTAAITAGKVLSVDASAALAMEGVVDYVDASDIPGENNGAAMGAGEPVFVADGKVLHHAQPIGMIVADTVRHAAAAAAAVVVEYEEAEALLDPREAAKVEGRTAPFSHTYVRGDAKAALDRAPEGTTTVSGDIYIGGQKHFYMEPQSAYVIPDEDGSIRCWSAAQFPLGVQSSLCRVLGLPMHAVHTINRRCGGGFGGKGFRNTQHSCAAAIAAVKLGRPVRVILDRNTDMRLTGGRHDMYTSYRVSFDADGIVHALDADNILNAGYSMDASPFCSMAVARAFDEGYYVADYRTHVQAVFTDYATRTAVRGPGEIQATWAVESILERVAFESGVPARLVRERNLYPADDPSKCVPPAPEETPAKPLTHYTLPLCWARVKETADIEAREAAVAAFNAEHRWRKRGLAMVPVKYAVGVRSMAALLNVYADGTVLITHGGAEIGQGIHTKVAQVASYYLGQLTGEALPLDLIKFSDQATEKIPNMSFTGGSTTSESSCAAIKEAACELVERLKPLAAALEKAGKELTWQNFVGAGMAADVHLQVVGHAKFGGDKAIQYWNYGVGASEVEVDVLTGESRVLRSDIVYDCGLALNPAIDIGQVEGAFIMGVSHVLMEDVKFDDSGKLLSDGTWEYKPMLASDVPVELNVELLQEAAFEKGILSSKASGEPPLVLASSVACAVRQAIQSARADAGLTDWVPLPLPLSPEVVRGACAVSPEALVLDA